MRVFESRHLLNENDVNIFETIKTRHFNTSNYIKSVVGEVHLLNLINELLLFLSISLIFDISVHRRKNKTCVTKTLFTNFTRRNCFLQVWNNLFIVLKIRSHAKLTSVWENRIFLSYIGIIDLLRKPLLSSVIELASFPYTYVVSFRRKLTRRRNTELKDREHIRRMEIMAAPI